MPQRIWPWKRSTIPQMARMTATTHRRKAMLGVYPSVTGSKQNVISDQSFWKENHVRQSKDDKGSLPLGGPPRRTTVGNDRKVSVRVYSSLPDAPMIMGRCSHDTAVQVRFDWLARFACLVVRTSR